MDITISGEFTWDESAPKKNISLLSVPEHQFHLPIHLRRGNCTALQISLSIYKHIDIWRKIFLDSNFETILDIEKLQKYMPFIQTSQILAFYHT
jgi:hypothetical protein